LLKLCCTPLKKKNSLRSNSFFFLRSITHNFFTQNPWGRSLFVGASFGGVLERSSLCFARLGGLRLASPLLEG
jgi:hypothetical protein